MSEKSDILTPWKEMDRRRREVYTESGVPDGALRRGMYHRAWNSEFPHLNSTEGRVPVPADLLVGTAGPRFDRDSTEVRIGEVYDLRVFWGSGTNHRLKCPGCAKFVKPALEITCRCGSILSQKAEPGHYQVVRIT